MQSGVFGKTSSLSIGPKRSIQSTAFDQVNDLLDRLMGPSAYQGVYLLNRAAEYCSDQCLIESTKHGPYCNGFADACNLLTSLADSLDAYLVESYIGGQQ